MILVPNLRQRSSGSKGFLILCLIVPLFSSCSLFRKADTDQGVINTGGELDPIQGRRVYDPETGTYVIIDDAALENMDTVQWKEVPPTTYPPITSEGGVFNPANPNDVVSVDDRGSEKLSSYNVSILIPFLTSKFNPVASRIYDNSTWALQFYGGARMALDKLAAEGVKMTVNVLDSEADPGTVNNLLRNNRELESANLILGPYRRENVALVAEFANLNETVLVSPQSAASRISQNNPNYIQVNPTLETHCVAIMQHALRHYSPENIVLVSKNDPSELARLDYFRNEYLRLMQGRASRPLSELIISDGSADLRSTNIGAHLGRRDTTVFIVPSWSDETYIIALQRKIDQERDPYEVVVMYGMPQWMTFEGVDYDIYEKLNVHVSSSSFIDDLSPEIKLFKRQFYDLYGTVPNEEAYLGYDTMLYFGRMLQKYGTKFQYYLEGETWQALHTRFDFERVVIPTTTGNEFPVIQQFENKFLNILEFQDYQFRPAN